MNFLIFNFFFYRSITYRYMYKIEALITQKQLRWTGHTVWKCGMATGNDQTPNKWLAQRVNDR